MFLSHLSIHTFLFPQNTALSSQAAILCYFASVFPRKKTAASTQIVPKNTPIVGALVSTGFNAIPPLKQIDANKLNRSVFFLPLFIKQPGSQNLPKVTIQHYIYKFCISFWKRVLTGFAH